MICHFLLLLCTVLTKPAPPELAGNAISGLKRKAFQVTESIAKKAILNDRVLRSHHKPPEARFLKVSRQVANIFGKSHGRFTIPTEQEKLIAMNAVYQLKFAYRIKLQHLYDSAKKLAATPRLENHEKELALFDDKIGALKKVIGNLEAAKNEIYLLPTVSPEIAALFGKPYKSFEIPTKKDTEISMEDLEWRIWQTSRQLDNSYDQAMDERNPGDQTFSSSALERIKTLRKKMKNDKDLIKKLESIPVQANA